MAEYLNPIKTTTLSQGFGLVQRHEFELLRRDGQWQKQVRETYDRGDGAGILICDRSAKEVILIRQFRYPAFYRGENPYLIEVCAGKLEGDDPETCARKEALEETGYRVGEIVKVADCFMSPGAVTERLTMFLGFVDGRPETTGGGLHNEGEDIEVLRLSLGEAMRLVGTGEIADAKTVILLQHAALAKVFG